jgi:hypothetical protein
MMVLGLSPLSTRFVVFGGVELSGCSIVGVGQIGLARGTEAIATSGLVSPRVFEQSMQRCG